MATITAILNQNYAGKKSNGSFPIVIRVAHNGDKKFYGTGYKVPLINWSDEQQRVIDKKGVRVLDKDKINAKIAQMIGEANKYKTKCEVNNLSFNIEKVFTNEFTDGNFTKFFKQRIAKLDQEEKMAAIKAGESIIKHLSNWHKGKDVYYSDLNSNSLEELLEYFKKQGNLPSTIKGRFAYMASIYERAMKLDNAPAPNPFKQMDTIKVNQVKKEWLTPDELDKLINLPLVRKSQKRARDMFLFSYYCRGMRFQNVTLLKKSDIKDDRIHWVSVKSNVNVSMFNHPKILTIIERWKKYSKGEYLFFDKLPDATPKIINETVHSKNILINYALKNVLLKAGIDKHIRFHCARHTFANHFRKTTKNIHAIQDALTHSSPNTTQVYLSSFTDEHLEKELLPMYG